jgi:GNAT superfamily N-acetyltransferase
VEFKKSTWVESVDDFLESWNQSTNPPYHLTKRLIQEKIIESRTTIPHLAFSYYYNQHYVASIAIKSHWEVETDKVSAYISVMYVDPKYRRLGIGRQLIEEVTSSLLESNYTMLRLCGDDQCLFSGLFEDENFGSHLFFKNLGFVQESKNYNLFSQIPLVEAIHLPEGFRVEVAINHQKHQEAVQFVKEHFSARWTQEVLQCDPMKLYLLYDDQTIIGFVVSGDEHSHALPNSVNMYHHYLHLAGIGPLGLHPKNRALGLGTLFVKTVHNDLYSKGYKAVMVDWTHLLHFYKQCGFTQIHSSYIQYVKSIGGYDGQQITNL